MMFTALLGFTQSEDNVGVWLVRKNAPKLPAIHGKWNGIGGKLNDRESTLLGAIREFREETGIILHPADVVPVEYQIFTPFPSNERYHVAWFAAWLPENAVMPPYNDADEPLATALVKNITVGHPTLAPNVGYLVPKALTLLRTEPSQRPLTWLDWHDKSVV